MTTSVPPPVLEPFPPVRARERGLVALLLAIFALLAVHSMARKSPTFDETAHLAAGISYVQTGDFRMNAEHPALPKILAGSVASLSGVRVRTDTDAWANARQWDFAHEALYASGVDWHTILFLGRLPMVALGVVLGWIVWRWTRSLAGPESAAIALAFFVFCPNLLAHARLVTTDVPLTLCVVGAAWCLWLARKTGSPRAVLGASVFVALSMVTKFSAFSYAPVWAVLAIVPSDRRPLRAGLVHLAILAVVSVILTEAAVCASYGFAWNWTTFRDLGLAGRGLTPETMSPLRRVPYEIMASVPWPSADFARGLKDILLYTEAGHSTYLLGKTSNTGWWWSSFVTMLVKIPLPLMLLMGVAKLELLRTPRARRGDLLFLILPAALVILTNVAAHLGLGVRHLLPMFPFGMIFAAWPLRGGWPGRGPLRLGLLVLVAWQAFGALRMHPHYLPWFNELAALAGGGDRILGDSNLDWGQDLSLASSRLKERGVTQAILGYFGTADPFAEGIEWQLLPPTSRPKAADPWIVLPPTGEEWLVLSTTNRQGVYVRTGSGGPPYPWLADVKPAEVVGRGTMALYEISGNMDVQRGLADLYLRHGLGEEAEAALRRVLDRVSYDGESRKKLVAVLLSRGELASADSAIVAGPNPDAEMLLTWTSILRKLGDDNRTREAYETALLGFPTSAELKNAYAWFLQDTGLDLGRALQLANEAVQMAPADPYYLDTRGMVNLRRRALDDALADFDAALAAPGGDLPAIRFHRVLVLAEAGREEDAMREAHALSDRHDLDDELRIELEKWIWEAER